MYCKDTLKLQVHCLWIIHSITLKTNDGSLAKWPKFKDKKLTINKRVLGDFCQFVKESILRRFQNFHYEKKDYCPNHWYVFVFINQS